MNHEGEGSPLQVLKTIIAVISKIQFFHFVRSVNVDERWGVIHVSRCGLNLVKELLSKDEKSWINEQSAVSNLIRYMLYVQ
jgi:hypothetical protein